MNKINTTETVAPVSLKFYNNVCQLKHVILLEYAREPFFFVYMKWFNFTIATVVC